MIGSLGDFAVSTIIDFKFTTVDADGVPTDMASEAVSVYKDNGTTESTAGVTLTAPFDSVVGMNHVRIDTSADGTFYSAGSMFDVVVSAGTVDGTSVVGYVVGRFSIEKTSALRPTTAGRTLNLESDGVAHADVKEWLGVAPLALTSQRVEALVGAMANNVVTAAAIATGAIDADAIADNAIDAGAIAADAITDAKVAADVTIASVTGAVGSVTGNVGGNVAGSVGSVTGNVGGNVTGSVGSVASGGITATSIAADAIGAAELSAAAANKLADHIIRRALADARASSDGDSVVFRSILGAMSKLVNKVAVDGTDLEIFDETDAGAPFGVQAITTDGAAEPITSLDTA